MRLIKLGTSLGACLFLLGCDVLPRIPLFAPAPETAPTQLALSGGIVAQGPNGYCVDRESSKSEAGFALVVPCSLLDGDEESELPETPALITFQTAQDGAILITGNEAALDALLQSDEGKALLGEGDIELSDTLVDAGTVVALYDVKGDDQLDGLGNTIWRAFTDVNDRMMTVSVREYADRPLSDAEGQAILTEVLTTLGNEPES